MWTAGARGALADRRRRGRRVEVQRDRVDVAEDRPRALVEQAVRRGDEAERAGHHLVARRPSRAPGPRGAAPRSRRRRRPRRRPRASSAKSRSKRSSIGPSESRPERSTSSTSSSSRSPSSGRASGIGSARAHRHARRRRRRRCGWNAYSSESTSASHEASMMFSETPIEPHSRWPSEESSRTRVTAPVPWCSSRIRTL